MRSVRYRTHRRADVRSEARRALRGHTEHRPQRLARRGFQGIDTKRSKHIAKHSTSLDQDRFTHDSRRRASSFEHEAKSQVLYAGSNAESKSHENENFHEQTLLSLMKRWYKPI
ncbi:hypothetical protein BYI23_A022490 [Burkholderia sp. YI23]|nr:hypothetical protein BYI23_A022490 [Burkholderia sp. YI23]